MDKDDAIDLITKHRDAALKMHKAKAAPRRLFEETCDEYEVIWAKLFEALTR